MPINWLNVFKHKYLLKFHSGQQFVWNYGLEMLFIFFLIHIRITTELLKALKENVSMYPCLGTHRVKEALGRKFWRLAFLFVWRVLACPRVTISAEPVRAWSEHWELANQPWNLKEQPLYSHLHQLNTIYNTIKTDRYNWINRK